MANELQSNMLDEQGIDKTRFLNFVGETAPQSLSLLAETIVGLIDVEISDGSDKHSLENRAVLRDLRQDILDVTFDSVINLDRPRFVLTPQELIWLDRHPQSVWVKYLAHRYKFKLYPVMNKLTSFPPNLLIEPTSVCNLRCVMCFQVDKSFSSNRQFMGMMDWDLFTSVVDQAADNDCHAITLASRGEPTLHKKFGAMLAYLNEKKILDSKFNTNATRLNDKLIHDILSADISTVTFSVDASTPESYERIRVGGKFNQVLANIERFNEIRQAQYPDSPTTTRVSGVAIEGTQNPEEMRGFWSEHVDHVTIVAQVPRYNSYENNSFGKGSVCNLLYERTYVWFDGICNPCDFDYKSLLSVGNAKEKPISDIWLGEKYSRLRELHQARMRFDVAPCDRCPL